MIDSTVETRAPALEISKEAFFAKLNEQDRNNLEGLSNNFSNIMMVSGLRGALIAVGGIMTKPLPRKDIDIKAVIESNKVKQEKDTMLDYACEKFKELEGLGEQIVKNDPSYSIDKTYPPSIDEEFGSPSILKNDGTLILTKKGTTPIELLNSVEGPTDKIIKQQINKFCVIARI